MKPVAMRFNCSDNDQRGHIRKVVALGVGSDAKALVPGVNASIALATEGKRCGKRTNCFTKDLNADLQNTRFLGVSKILYSASLLRFVLELK